ncbi:hypothetical protein [Herbidospora mongoliensis]|uniref:hypothetical protein n=1 Tax=Herbidospora mongoliensis TaxID=688067 RepID=UPI00082BD5A4|nr:hypothetical protein [Herbidospora mongoliensis]
MNAIVVEAEQLVSERALTRTARAWHSHTIPSSAAALIVAEHACLQLSGNAAWALFTALADAVADLDRTPADSVFGPVLAARRILLARVDALAVYLVTGQPPHVPDDDEAELLAVAHALGVVRPPAARPSLTVVPSPEYC